MRTLVHSVVLVLLIVSNLILCPIVYSLYEEVFTLKKELRRQDLWNEHQHRRINRIEAGQPTP